LRGFRSIHLGKPSAFRLSTKWGSILITSRYTGVV
jgi:hypothetical protein